MAEMDIVFWHWWVLAVFLLSLEILTPGFFFLWLSISGFIVGLVLLANETASLEIQILLFAILSIFSIFIWRRFGRNTQAETDHPLLNQKGAQYIGRIFPVIEAIENGRGKIKAGDSLWIVQGEDCPIGSSVKVIATSGTIFEVKLVDNKL